MGEEWLIAQWYNRWFLKILWTTITIHLILAQTGVLLNTLHNNEYTTLFTTYKLLVIYYLTVLLGIKQLLIGNENCANNNYQNWFTKQRTNGQNTGAGFDK